MSTNPVVDNSTTVRAIATRAQTQWYKRPADQRFETLEELQASVDSRRRRSMAEDVPVLSLLPEVREDELVLVANGEAVTFTNWSFGQVAAAAKAPASYLRTLKPELASECLSYGLRDLRDHGGDDAMKLMTIDPEAFEESPDIAMATLQAMTGTGYGRIWDADTVKAVRELVGASNGEFYNPKDWSGKPSGLYASDRDCFMFLIDGGSIIDGGSDRDQLHRGFMVWNSEVGAKSWGCSGFYFRGCCGNHSIWGAQQKMEIRIPHFANAPERFVTEALPALQKFMHTSVRQEEAQIRKAKAYALPAKEDDAIDLVMRATGVTKRMVQRAFQTALIEEGHVTNLWDALNGLTAVARKFEHMDTRVDFERQAGKLMELVAE